MSGERPHPWSYVCFTICDRLVRETALPVDFQIQRRTEADDKHKGRRSPLELRKLYAGGGDATNLLGAGAA